MAFLSKISVQRRVQLLTFMALSAIVMLSFVNYFSQASSKQYQSISLDYAQVAGELTELKSTLFKSNDFAQQFVSLKEQKLRDMYDISVSEMERAFGRLSAHLSYRELQSIEETINAYRAQIEKSFRLRKELGLTADDGLEGDLRTAVHAIEDRLYLVDDKELTVIMLMMRRHEKDFMMRKQSKYIDRWNDQNVNFVAVLESRNYSHTQKQELLGLLTDYQAGFRLWSYSFLSLEKSLIDAQDRFNQLVDRLVSMNKEKMQLANEFDKQYLDITRQTTEWVWSLVFLIAIISVVITYWIGNSIARPIRNMAESMRYLAAGERDLEELKGLKTRNELVYLEQVVGLFRETLIEMHRLNKEVSYHRDNLAKEVSDRTLELQEKTLRLEQSLEAEKELNSMQNQFVSMVSHEIRTPLAIIDGTARRVSNKIDIMSGEQIVERMRNIRGSVQRMSNMVEQTLDLSRISEGKMNIVPEKFALRSLVDEIVSRHAEIETNCTFECKYENVPPEMFADRSLVDHMLTNLISNAVKYSRNNPRVVVSVFGQDETVLIKVRDHGVGIPKSELDNITKRFFRASTSNGIPGTGLGLNLVSKLVDMHSGGFRIDSEEGKWTEVSIHLPVDATFNDLEISMKNKDSIRAA